MKFNWGKLKKPFFALAPMEGATDTVFRQIVIDCGRPDVLFTEFTNVQGLLSKGSKQVSQRLKFEDYERPIIAQIWGNNPEYFYKAAHEVSKMGFDGIDINMGCPERNIVKKGSCSALIKTPDLAKQIIKATRKGAELSEKNLPISVKTRIGFSTISYEWIEFLLTQNLPALTLHLRTTKEMSKVPAHWEFAKDFVKLKNEISPNTILIGNGDVESISEGKKKAEDTGMDGIMIGRGVFHNPFVFSGKNYDLVSREEKFKLLRKHIELFESTWNDEKSYQPLKRYFKIYINGFDGASDMREKIMLTNNLQEGKELLKNMGI